MHANGGLKPISGALYCFPFYLWRHDLSLVTILASLASQPTPESLLYPSILGITSGHNICPAFNMACF